MAVDVTAFSAMARAEFMQGKLAADDKPFPAGYDLFTTQFPSTTRVETHTFMSNLPRLAEFKGYNPGSRLTSKEYTVANKEYRAGPVSVRETDLADDQIGGYLKTIQGLPNRAKKDIGHMTLAHLAAGTTGLCFDGTAMFADSHTVGSGDNLRTENFAANDGVTHKVIAMVVDNPVIKPVIFQDRQPLSGLQDDTADAVSKKLKEFEYWADCRFGLGYGFWWDAVHVTITDTPTVAECYDMIERIVNAFRSFTLPRGKDTDDLLYVHEGWDPNPQNFVLACNLQLGQVLKRALSITQYVASTGNVDNVYKDVATVVPTSALN